MTIVGIMPLYKCDNIKCGEKARISRTDGHKCRSCQWPISGVIDDDDMQIIEKQYQEIITKSKTETRTISPIEKRRAEKARKKKD